MQTITSTPSERARDVNAVAEFWSRLSLAGESPLVVDTMEAALESLRLVPGSAGVAVAIDPLQAAALDATWDTGRPWCLATAPDGSSGWSAPAGGWPAVRSAAAGRSNWSQAPLAGAVTVVAAGEPPVMVLAMAGEAGPAADAARRQVLAPVAASAMAALSSLAALAALQAEVVRLAGENHALGRLNRLQGRFVAMASHDFNAPLTAITAYTEVLLGQVGNEGFPHAVEFLGVIRSESGRLLRMVDRILDFTRVEFGPQLMTLEPVELSTLVHEAVRALAPSSNARGLQVAVEAPAFLPRAEVDADLIRQVIVNLLGNAVKYTPAGGHVRIVLSEEEASVAVSVQDDGPGIPSEDIRRIFREFYRAEGAAQQAEGSGLGLSIARHIVQLHGGHIEARRLPQGGSEFRFLVPKEMGELAAMPQVTGLQVSPEKASQLISVVLRTVAELSGSLAVVLMLGDGRGALVPVGSLGLRHETRRLRPVILTEAWRRFLLDGRAQRDPGSIVGDLNLGASGDMEERLYCPLVDGEEPVGVIIAGRRTGEAGYGAPERQQLEVLARIITTALRHFEGNEQRVLEALQVLLQTRRTGIPTSTPEALHLVARLARSLGLGVPDARRLLYAATLHDAGMARVEDEIVLGAAPLSWDERDEVDRHVEQGCDLVAPLLPDPAVRSLIRHHHERMDGSGHPDGLSGESIPLGARILAVVDAWFSLTKDRPFRTGLDPAAAMAEIRANVGTQFDPHVVDAFEELMATPESGTT
ncbi:MAG: HD domain-containing protein [bacterium]|nr:HD domain-containing protein [bacterium]